MPYIVSVFMTSLPSRFKAILKEMQAKRAACSAEAPAFAPAVPQAQTTAACSNCGLPGHKSQNCPRPNVKKLKAPKAPVPQVKPKAPDLRVVQSPAPAPAKAPAPAPVKASAPKAAPRKGSDDVAPAKGQQKKEAKKGNESGKSGVEETHKGQGKGKKGKVVAADGAAGKEQLINSVSKPRGKRGKGGGQGMGNTPEAEHRGSKHSGKGQAGKSGKDQGGKSGKDQGGKGKRQRNKGSKWWKDLTAEVCDIYYSHLRIIQSRSYHMH